MNLRVAVIDDGWLRFHHPFGHAGLEGFKQEGVRNLKAEGRHSVDFTEPTLTIWADRIVGKLAGQDKLAARSAHHQKK